MPNNILKIWNKENTTFSLLFLAAIVIIYFSPFLVNQIFFLILIIVAYRSKMDYFWIAFVFLLLDAPGRLFEGGALHDTKRIAFYTIVPNVSFAFAELFIIAFIFKSIRITTPHKFIFKKDFKFLFFYALFVILYSIPLGFGFEIFIKLLRLLIPWSFLYIFPKVLRNEADFLKINQLIFPFVFLALAAQLHTFITGIYWSDYLKGIMNIRYSNLVLEDSEAASRAYSSVSILFYCFYQSLFLLAAKRKTFPFFYLYLILFASFLSIFLSATRSWILVFSFITISSIFLVKKSKILLNHLKLIIVGIFMLIILNFLFPFLRIQLENTINRIQTVKSLAEGDITAGHTLGRFNQRGPRVLNKFKESPVIGWGFSNKFFDYSDTHVGHHNILLNVGVLGYGILLFFLIKWVIKIYSIGNNNFIIPRYGYAFRILLLTLLGVFFLNTVTQFWGFTIAHKDRIIWLSLFFSFLNALYWEIASENVAPVR